MIKGITLVMVVAIIAYSYVLLKPQDGEQQIDYENQVVGLNPSGELIGSIDWQNDSLAATVDFECNVALCLFTILDNGDEASSSAMIKDELPLKPVVFLYPARLLLLETDEYYYVVRPSKEVGNRISKKPAISVTTSFVGMADGLDRINFVSTSSALERPFSVSWNNEVW